MKKLLLLLICFVPMLAKAQTPDSIVEASTVYDEYYARYGDILVCKVYELPELKSNVSGSANCKCDIVSFNVEGKISYFMRLKTSGYYSRTIVRYIAYSDLLALRTAIDELENRVTSDPIGSATWCGASYSCGENTQLGYEITKSDKGKETIVWFFNCERRREIYRSRWGSAAVFKDYLSDVIARIKKLM